MVTTLYAGILGLIYIGLTAYVIKGRLKHQVEIGDAGNKDLIRRIRAHSNFIEYVPLALLLIVFAEFEGVSETIIHGLGGTLIIARLMHATGLTRKDGVSIGRSGGTILTLLVVIIASILCVKSFFIF